MKSFVRSIFVLFLLTAFFFSCTPIENPQLCVRTYTAFTKSSLDAKDSTFHYCDHIFYSNGEVYDSIRYTTEDHPAFDTITNTHH